MIVLSLGMSSCSTKKYSPQEYISATGIASPDTETKVELADGAGIIIPENSLDSEATIKVERNPDKATKLPSLDDGFVQVSDFYNFEIINGNLTGPVDLTFPINQDLIPKKDGVLVMAIPTENGWEYVPAEAKDGKVTIFTDNIGDPIIAWHFNDPADIKPICDPEIAVQAVQNGDNVEIIGKLMPIRASLNFFGTTVEPAGGISVSIVLNKETEGETEKRFTAETQSDGSFSLTLEPSQGLKENWNWVFVNAQCKETWWGFHTVQSKGYAEFKYSMPSVSEPVATPTVSSQSTIVPTIVAQQPTPTGAVLIPNFTGKTFTEAKDWLEANGFKYTWIDGSSSYDLGMVYKQAPVGGQYKVPHRTTVVLYRTNEKVTDPCALMSLTPEECANNGLHQYVGTSCKSDTIINADSKFGCTCKGITLGGTHKSTFNFLGSGILESSKGEKYSFIETNTYGITLSYSDGEGGQYTADMIILFSLDGYQTTSISTRVGNTGTITCKEIFQYEFSE